MLNQQAKLFVKSLNVVRLVPNNGSPRPVGIGCGAAYLTLAGCSTCEAGAPKSAVNYQKPSRANTENHTRSLEQAIGDQRRWYQTFE